MARILLLDDDSTTRQALTDRLVREGHDVRSVAGLSAFRRYYGLQTTAWRPDLVLVELVRWKGNGFSLAALLATRTPPDARVPVWLLSDRGLRDDVQWAKARGIEAVVDRRAQGKELLRKITELEGKGVTLQTPAPDKTSPPANKDSLMCAESSPSIAQTTIQPLLASLVQHIDELLAAAAPLRGSREADIAAWHRRCVGWLGGLGWLGELLPAGARLSDLTDAQNPALSDPQALARVLLIWRRRLVVANQSVTSELGRLPHEQSAAPPLQGLLHRLLHRLLQRFLQEFARASPGAPVDRRAKALARQLLHATLAGRVLGGVSDEQGISITLTLLSLLHDELQCKDTAVRELAQRIRKPGSVPDSEFTGPVLLSHGDQAELLTAWAVAPGRDVFQRLVIHLYRLLVVARLDGTATPSRVLLSSLYFSAASCLTSSELYRQESAEVVRLLHKWNTGSRALVGLIAGLECRIAFRLPDEDARYSLASGLYHLPRPQSLGKSINLQGRLRSEIMRELEMLVAGARELKVQKVEALAALVLELHRQAQVSGPDAEGGLLPVLASAHLRLCRLLDQAAAWQPPDDIAAIIARICLAVNPAATLSPSGAGHPDSACNEELLWNSRMTVLVRQSSDLRDSRGLLLEMLSCQRRLSIDRNPHPSAQKQL